MNIFFYIIATILFMCFAVKSWGLYKAGNGKVALAELIGSVIASMGGVILINTFFVF